MNTFATNQALHVIEVLFENFFKEFAMPHKNYCQQCQVDVTLDMPKTHDETHTIIPNVADRSTYPIIKIESPPDLSPLAIYQSIKTKKQRTRRQK
jgi:hypothetical protein